MSLFSIGISGLNSFQRALGTIGHNIVNANTEGYSRQEVTLESRTPQFGEGAYFGTGVQVGGTRRIFDSFFQSTYRQNISTYHKFEELNSKASEIDSLVADPSTGLSEALENFFSAVDGVANDPSSIPARQVMLTQGTILTDRFHRLDSQLVRLSDNINEEFDQLALEINALAINIANMNSNIVQAQGLSTDLPSDMLDQRDLLIDQLSELIDVTVVDQQNGAVNVLVGGGDTLVIDTTVNQIVSVNTSEDSTEKELRISIGGSQKVISSVNAGGKVGGLLEFREETLHATRNSLGRVAVGLSETFNDQHNLGLDLNGTLGLDFFNRLTSINAIGNDANLGSATISGTITDINQLEVSDYQITYDGNYNVTRLSDNVNLGAFAGPNIDLSGEGFTLNVSGTSLLGDSFLVQPTRQAGQNIQISLEDARLIAGAAPIKTTTYASNTGSGEITQGSVTSVSGAEFTTTAGSLTPPLLIQFETNTTYRIYDNTNPGAPVDISPGGNPIAFTPNQTNQIIPASLGYGYTVDLSGAPAAGDNFEVIYNTGAVSDNRNMLALSSLQSKALLNSGTTTYRQAYGQLVADVGNKTREFEISEDASLSLLRQSESRKEAVSGVNLDEEAAKLIQFQNAFQAAAQVIVAASRVIEELINATR